MNKDYSGFSTDDFIADEYFQQWAGFPDNKTNAFWQQWIAHNPLKKNEVLDACAFIHNLHFKTAQPTSWQIETSLQRNLANIKQIEQVPNQKSNKGILRALIFRWAAAAVFVISCATAVWYYSNRKQITFELATANGETKTILLPDSSVVILNASSSISYVANMANQVSREVWLEGEGFFTVKHIEPASQPAHRFIVHCGNLNVEVFGTSFNVKKKAAVTNVSLNTGKIKIDIKDHPESAIFLEPGDFIQYSETQKHILKKKVKPELYSVWKEEKLTLDNMPLFEIAKLLEDAYGYSTKIKNKALAESKVSGTLYLKDEESLLKTLAFTLNIDIIKKDSVLLFQPKN